MAKRIWKKQFAGYLTLIAGPVIAVALALLGFPEMITPYILDAESATLINSIPGVMVFARFTGLSLLLPGILLFTVQGSPNQFREIIFWIGVQFLLVGGLLAAGPFLFHLTYIALVPAVFLILAFLFLMTFATKNLLIRE